MIQIVGAGLAGLSCAIHLAYRGIPCNLISKQESYRAQSVMAEGGINGAINTMGEDDDPSLHYEDTLRGGAYLGEPKAIKELTNHAPELIYWLKSLGVPFETKDGKIVQRNFGGQKKKRTAYVKSSTGKMLMTALIDEARKYEVQGLIHRYDHHEAYDVLIDGKKCLGLKMRDLYTGKCYQLNGPVVLAMGGLTGFFEGYTTGSTDNTGLLVSQLFAKGLEVANLEMIQYHPTTIAIHGKRLLVSEAARGEGGRFMTYKDGQPYYFMEEMYPEYKNLVTRDVASRTIYQIQQDPTCKGIYLDMRNVDPSVWSGKLSDMREELLDYLGIDIAKEPFEIEPGIHYFMGGVHVDDHHQTNFDGLYAAGECACKYHGANRLGGNSLLGAIYGGKVLGDSLNEDESNEMMEVEEEVVSVRESFSDSLREILLSGLGIQREEKKIQEAINQFEQLHPIGEFEKAKSLLAMAMLKSALERKESRGAHYRIDYPETNDQYQKTSVATYHQEIEIHYEDLNGGEEE